jgi:hypothetical protein
MIQLLTIKTQLVHLLFLQMVLHPTCLPLRISYTH